MFTTSFHLQFRRLAHVLSLMLSFIMGTALLVTSCLMVNMYIKYCDYLLDHNDQPYYPNHYKKCGDDEAHFIILPVFGFFTMAAWVRIKYCYCKQVDVLSSKNQALCQLNYCK